MKYYLIAGEPSGDLHGNELIAAIRRARPDAEIRFWDSSRMVSVMGLVEVLRHAGSIASIYRKCRHDMAAFAPDVVILIDYPGFNLKMAEFAHNRGCKVYYYIAPKLWARNPGRIRGMRRNIDRLYTIFPFETEFFTNLNLPPRYFGNPLPEKIEKSIKEQSFSPAEGRKVIAFLPGSRNAEISWLMPRFLKVIEILSQDSKWREYDFIIPVAPGRRLDCNGNDRIQLVHGATYAVLESADAAVVCSGTASLETAIIGTPQVVCYGFNPITYCVAKMMMRCKYVSLANLILDKLIFKELLQRNCTPERIVAELERLVFDSGCRAAMKKDYEAVRKALMPGGSPIAAIAADIASGGAE